MGDREFAATCRKIFQSGQRLSVERLFNGEYFIQQVDLAQHPKDQYADGCLADQVFGQGGRTRSAWVIYIRKETVASALRSIWKYDWAPDVGPQDQAHPPQRWFAMPGEAGLFTCTWPRSKHLGKTACSIATRSGRASSTRWPPTWSGRACSRRPWRFAAASTTATTPPSATPGTKSSAATTTPAAMASYGVFLALCGFEYHGPEGHLGFVPKLGADDFRAAFTLG